MGLLYTVHSYSAEVISDLLEPSSKKLKQQTTYFQTYLSDLNAQTIVVEDQYVDRDYLDDFAGYYVRCFTDYKRFCKRLHFFSKKFTEENLASFLTDGSGSLTIESLQNSYLGFLVLKPLPETIVGRTCLRPYETEGTTREVPTLRPYHAHLFGLEFEVQSLAFQEQDKVVAACATSALWSMFQQTGKMFQHHIPSPLEITQTAGQHWVVESRMIPSKGLQPDQISYVIRELGMESLFLSAVDDYFLRANLYAYLRSKIPVLIVIQLKEKLNEEVKHRGSHAVTAVGFNLGGKDVEPYGDNSFNLRSSRIDKIYVHDDHVGPFARMERSEGNYSTSWPPEFSDDGIVTASPSEILVPLYHKIRIPFQTIFDAVIVFDGFARLVAKAAQELFTENIEWDIYLTDVNEAKKDIRTNGQIDGARRKELLTRSMPLYLWRATGTLDGAAILDIFFDATDIEQGTLFQFAVEYNPDIAKAFRLAAQSKVAAQTKDLQTGPVASIIQHFMKPSPK